MKGDYQLLRFDKIEFFLCTIIIVSFFNHLAKGHIQMTTELRVSFCFAQIVSLLNCCSIVYQEAGICETKCANRTKKVKSST